MQCHIGSLLALVCTKFFLLERRRPCIMVIFLVQPIMHDHAWQSCQLHLWEVAQTVAALVPACDHTGQASLLNYKLRTSIGNTSTVACLHLDEPGLPSWNSQLVTSSQELAGHPANLTVFFLCISYRRSQHPTPLSTTLLILPGLESRLANRK